MKIKLVFENKMNNVTFENNTDSFKDLIEVICRSNWYGLDNKIYVNVSKIVRIEIVE